MSDDFNTAIDYRVTQRIYLTKDRRAVVPEGNKRAAFLLVGVPGPVTRTMAKRIVSFKDGIKYLRTLGGERVKTVEEVKEDVPERTLETGSTLKRFTNKRDLVAFAENAFGVQLDEADTRAILTNKILDAQDVWFQDQKKDENDNGEDTSRNQGSEAEV